MLRLELGCEPLALAKREFAVGDIGDVVHQGDERTAVVAEGRRGHLPIVCLERPWRAIATRQVVTLYGEHDAKPAHRLLQRRGDLMGSVRLGRFETLGKGVEQRTSYEIGPLATRHREICQVHVEDRPRRAIGGHEDGCLARLQKDEAGAVARIEWDRHAGWCGRDVMTRPTRPCSFDAATSVIRGAQNVPLAGAITTSAARPFRTSRPTPSARALRESRRRASPGPRPEPALHWQTAVPSAPRSPSRA
jgi:hypothetical protein